MIIQEGKNYYYLRNNRKYLIVKICSNKLIYKDDSGKEHDLYLVGYN